MRKAHNKRTIKTTPINLPWPKQINTYQNSSIPNHGNQCQIKARLKKTNEKKRLHISQAITNNT